MELTVQVTSFKMVFMRIMQGIWFTVHAGGSYINPKVIQAKLKEKQGLVSPRKRQGSRLQEGDHTTNCLFCGKGETFQKQGTWLWQKNIWKTCTCADFAVSRNSVAEQCQSIGFVVKKSHCSAWFSSRLCCSRSCVPCCVLFKLPFRFIHSKGVFRWRTIAKENLLWQTSRHDKITSIWMCGSVSSNSRQWSNHCTRSC